MKSFFLAIVLMSLLALGLSQNTTTETTPTAPVPAPSANITTPAAETTTTTNATSPLLSQCHELVGQRSRNLTQATNRRNHITQALAFACDHSGATINASETCVKAIQLNRTVAESIAANSTANAPSTANLTESLTTVEMCQSKLTDLDKNLNSIRMELWEVFAGLGQVCDSTDSLRVKSLTYCKAFRQLGHQADRRVDTAALVASGASSHSPALSASLLFVALPLMLIASRIF